MDIGWIKQELKVQGIHEFSPDSLFEGGGIEGMAVSSWLIQSEMMLVWPHKSQSGTQGSEW